MRWHIRYPRHPPPSRRQFVAGATLVIRFFVQEFLREEEEEVEGKRIVKKHTIRTISWHTELRSECQKE